MDSERIKKNSTETPDFDSDITRKKSNPSARNLRDHGSYYSFHVVPRKNGNVKNTPNLVKCLKI